MEAFVKPQNGISRCMAVRILTIIGPLLSVAGAAGLYFDGAATVQAYEVLAHPLSSPQAPPNSAVSAFVTTSPLIFAVGNVLFLVGMGAVGLRASGIVRILIAISGLFVLAASGSLAWSYLEQQSCFDAIASSPVMPDFETIGPQIRSTLQATRLGWGCLILGQLVLAVAGGIPRVESRSFGSVSLVRKIVLMLTGVSAILFSTLFQIAWITYSASIDSITIARPSLLADVLLSTTTYLFLSALSLFTLAILQIAIGGLAYCPSEKRNRDTGISKPPATTIQR